MTTTNEPEPAPARSAPVSGWGWVVAGLGRIPRQRTEHERAWDGLFRAVCACGREVNWDAFSSAPICDCRLGDTGKLVGADDTRWEDPRDTTGGQTDMPPARLDGTP